MFFYVSCQFNAKSSAIDQLGLDDQPMAGLSLCGCIGPRASREPAPWRLGRLFIFARYSLRTRIV